MRVGFSSCVFYSNRAEPASKETMYLLSQARFPYPHIPPLGAKSGRERKAAMMLGDIYRKAEDSGYEKPRSEDLSAPSL